MPPRLWQLLSYVVVGEWREHSVLVQLLVNLSASSVYVGDAPVRVLCTTKSVSVASMHDADISRIRR